MFHSYLSDLEFRLTRVQRKSPTLGAEPPAGAIVLFDGTHVDEWLDGRLLDERLLDVGTTSKRNFGNIAIHLEFVCPSCRPHAECTGAIATSTSNGNGKSRS